MPIQDKESTIPELLSDGKGMVLSVGNTSILMDGYVVSGMSIDYGSPIETTTLCGHRTYSMRTQKPIFDLSIVPIGQASVFTDNGHDQLRRILMERDLDKYPVVEIMKYVQERLRRRG